jgi:hypothetical protein
MKAVSTVSYVLVALFATTLAQSRAVPASPAFSNFRDLAPMFGLAERTVIGEPDSRDYILETVGGGIGVVDYDNDGRPDIFVVNGARRSQPEAAPPSRLYRNTGSAFVDVTEKAGLTARGWGQGVCAGDYDNDGDTDLFVTYYGRVVLYRNDGKGAFTDVTATSGLAFPRPRWNSGAAFVDFDRDGVLDLFISAYVAYEDAMKYAPGSRRDCFWKGIPVMCGPQGLAGSQNALFRGKGDGTFVDVSESAGILKARPAFGLTPLVLDYDNDGWSDIYVANDSMASLLFRNKRDGTFEEVGLRSGAALTGDGRAQAGMGVAAADYDRDGWLDIAKTNFDDDTTSLYRNLGDGTFEDATFAAGIGVNTRFLGWGTGFLDVDRDGWPDLFMVNGHVYPQADRVGGHYSYAQRAILYRNAGGGRFDDVSERAGPGLLVKKASRGAAVADFFNTGRLGIVVNNVHDAPSLLHDCAASGAGPDSHALVVQLEGTRTNRSGIGARVTVKAAGRTFIDEIRSGGSFCSQNAFALHFGLGPQARVDSIEVAWPGGGRETIGATAADRLVVIREGAGIVRQTPFAANPIAACAERR